MAMTYSELINSKKKKKQEQPAQKKGIMTYAELMNSVEADRAAKQSGWFHKGAYDDGYQFGDLSKTVLGTLRDVENNMYTGIAGIGETVVDTGAYLLGGIGGLFGVNEFQRDMERFIEKDLYDEKKVGRFIGNGASAIGALSNALEQLGIDMDEDKNSVLGNKSDSLVQSGGQLLATAGLQAVGVPWWLTTGATSFGAEVENAFNQDATYAEAGGSALISAGAEILTEKISGGIKFGGKTLDDVLAKPLLEKISGKTLRTLAKLGMDTAGEGAEEVISQIFSNLGSALYREEDLTQIMASEEALQGYLESFIGGAVLGGVGGSIQALNAKASGKDYTTGLTSNEQNVVNVIANERIKAQEKGDKKLSSYQKSKIRSEVEADMDAGAIDVEQIERILGGEDYNSYKKLTEEMDEYNTLNKMKTGELTGEQIDRLAELKEKNKTASYKDETARLKNQLSQTVQELTKGDRLVESYKERARRGEAFKADVTKYKSEAAQKTIQNAMDSGNVNNTNRAHKFVEILARISEDKGIVFNFSDSKRIAELGYGVEGKTVNGYVEGGNVTLNMNSSQVLEKIVGHEVTHFLEGTEHYDALQKAMEEYVNLKGEGEYAKRLAEITERYKDVKDADAKKELLADLVGEYLFTDEDFVSHLSTNNRNLFQKIFDEIKYLVKTFTGTKEEQKLEEVKRVFERVWTKDVHPNADTVKRSLNPNFAQEIQTWYDTDKNNTGGFFEVGTTSAALKSIGVKSQTINMDKSKISKLMKDHPEMTIDVIKTIPNAIENPVIVMQSKTVKDSLTIYGEVYAEVDGVKEPVMVAMQLSPEGKNGRILNIQKVSNAYVRRGETKELTRQNAQKLINTSDILYIEPQKNRTDSWLRALGLQLPAGLTKYGPIGKVTYYADVVKNQDGEFGRSAFAEAFDRAGIKTSEGKTKKKYSISEDSQGRTLSTEQIEYFEDSQVRDENGNLKVMYHGTPNGDYTIFRDGTYFTENKEYADRYQSPSASSISTGKVASSPKTFEVYLNIKKLFDLSNPEAREIYINDYIKGGNASGINPYLSDAEYDKIKTIDWTEGEDLRDFLIENGYDFDGILLDEGADGGYGEEVVDRGSSYVVFSPEQIKSVDNTNPTSNPDINLSLSNDSDIAPPTKGTYGKDLAIDPPIREDIAPVQERVSQYVDSYSDHQKNNWKNSKKIVLYESETQLKQFVEDAKERKNAGKKLYFGKIQDEVAKRIESELGYDVNGYNCALYSDNVKKIFKDHGDEAKENLRGQRAVEVNDFVRIPEVVATATEIESGGDYNGQPVIHFKKDGITVVGVITEGALDLYPQTMYISKKNRSLATATDEQAPVYTSETTRSTASNNILPQSSENTSTFSEDLPIREDTVQQSKENVTDESLEKKLKSIDKHLEVDKNELYEDYQQKKAEAEDEIRDKNTYISNRAMELYQELQGLKKGVRASEKLGYLLDFGYEWRDLKTALLNARAKPDRMVNQNSEIESIVREMLRNEFEEKVALIGNIDEEYQNELNKLEKEAKEKRKAAGIADKRKKKLQELRQWAQDLIGDSLSKWVDKKMGLSYKVNTLRRNLRDIVRDENGKKNFQLADKIYDALQGMYNHNEALLNAEANKIKDYFRKLKITSAEDAYIQMLGEYRYNPDTTILAKDLTEFYNKHKDEIDTEKVDKIIEDARALYDDLFVRVNEVLREQGMKEIGYRKGYFPHFTEDPQSWLGKLFNWKIKNNNIPTDIAGLTEQFNPNRSYQSFDKHRTGDSTDYSFMKGLDTYVNGALDWIYHIEDIQKRRAFENEIRYKHSDKGVKEQVDAILKNDEYDAEKVQEEIDKVYANASNPLNNFVSTFRTQTNTLAGKKSSMDRQMEEDLSRRFYSTVTNISNRVTANMVGGSISSALTNFIPITQSWAEVNPVSSLKAMKETLGSYFKDDGLVGKSDFLTNRLNQNKALYQSGWDKFTDKVGILMEWVDNFTSQTVWRSKYMENISNGMSESMAIKNADQFAENVIAGRSRGNAPAVFDSKNPLTKVLTAFQLEVNNQYQYMFKDLPQEMQNEAKWKLAAGYGKMFIGAYAYNMLYSALTGRDAAFDPIGIIEEVLRDLGLFGDDEEEEPADVLLNFTDSIVEELPFVGGLMGGGRIPISSALPYDGLYKAFSGTVQDMADGDWANLTSEWLNPVFYLGLQVGGGQIRKTTQGLSMFDDDLPIAGSYTSSGKLRYSVPDTVGSKVKAAVFGQWANKNAQEYIEEGRTPLSDKKTAELAELDIPMKDYWDYQDGLKGLNTLGEKADYIAGLDLPVSKKNIMINNQTDRKDPIDLTDYDLYGNLEEMDYAISNPGKYAVSKAVGGYNSYKEYTDAIGEIEADKNAVGKSISGSRKRKVADYISNLNIDYGEKLILYKSMYPSDKAYNAKILKYLNGRNDISNSDKMAILKELGFTVTSDGKVRW